MNVLKVQLDMICREKVLIPLRKPRQFSQLLPKQDFPRTREVFIITSFFSGVVASLALVWLFCRTRTGVR